VVEIAEGPKKKAPTKYTTVLSEKDLNGLIGKLKASGGFALDTETTSVHPMRAKIVGLSFSTQADSGVYIPIQYKEKESSNFGGEDLMAVLEILKPVFENESIPKTGQNVKFDALILKRHGVDVKGIKFDTLLAAHLLKPESRTLKLDNLSMDHLNYRMIPIEDLIGKGKNQITMAEVELDKITFYAAEDADVTLQLTHIFEKELKKEGLDQFFNNVEMPLLPVLLAMEFNGTFVKAGIAYIEIR